MNDNNPTSAQPPAPPDVCPVCGAAFKYIGMCGGAYYACGIILDYAKYEGTWGKSGYPVSSCLNAEKVVDALRAQLAAAQAECEALRKDAEVGKAIREFIEQPLGDWEGVDVRLHLFRDGQQFGRPDELEGKVVVGTHRNLIGIGGEKNAHVMHGDNLYAALVAVGLLPSEGEGVSGE